MNPFPAFDDVASELVGLQHAIRSAVLRSRAGVRQDSLTEPVRQGSGDVSFQVDIAAEDQLDDALRHGLMGQPVLVISEGVGRRLFPEGARESDVAFTLIVDPVDGTRGISYDIRSAWSLAGMARGVAHSLQDIEFAVQTVIPTTLQAHSRVVAAQRGRGTFERVWDLDRGSWRGEPTRLAASSAMTLRNGFTSFVAFFPGQRARIARLADEVVLGALGDPQPGEAMTYEDSYICTGGQLYLLASGRYRLVADLRPTVDGIDPRRSVGLVAHPYDLASMLVATEAGAVVTRPNGALVDYPLDTHTGCDWIGYANAQLHADLSPRLERALKRLSD